MSPRSQGSLLVAIVVIAGALQVAAGVALGLASQDDLARAAAFGATPAILGMAAALALWALAWLLPGAWRWVVGALGTGAALATAALWSSPLALIYFGEFILHHFLTLLSAVIAATVVQGWALAPELGRLRAAPALVGGAAVVALVGAHVGGLWPLELGWVHQAGSAGLMAAVALGLGLLWRSLGAQARAVAVVAALPAATRLALELGGGASFAQFFTEPTAGLLSGAIAAGGVGLFILCRPRIDRWARVFAVISSATAVHWLFRVYEGSFVLLEPRLGGLLRSVFGFHLPFPTHAPGWAVLAVLAGLFGAGAAVLIALISATQRARGAALALVVTAGLGLTTPQVTLMHFAGLLALLAALRAEQGVEADGVAVVAASGGPPAPIEGIFGELAERLEMAAPLLLEQPAESVVALRGELGRVAVDLRARSVDGARWTVLLRVGLLGRGAPIAEVLPDPQGGAPGLRGETRALGEAAAAVMEALSAFPAAHGRFWSAGCEVALGAAQARLSGASLEALVRSLARAVGQGR
jgi:hypothetical protein